MRKLSIEILIPTLPDEKYLDRILNCAADTEFPVKIAIGALSTHEAPRRISWEEAKSILAHPPHKGARAEWFLTKKNRAHQLNIMMRHSTAQTFWILHADSVLEKDSWLKVNQFVSLNIDAIGYGQLSYQSDGPSLCWINAVGANLRSMYFGMPFEDQGLIVSRQLAEDLGGFRENIPYGEGHDLVWRAKLQSIEILPADYKISTSARRYKSEGWLKTTLRFAFLTWKQAAPFIWARLNKESRQTRGLAVFVKTGGLSQIKTRLAKTIGKQAAEKFQSLAIQMVAQTLSKSRGISIYWAVSESEGRFFEQWKQFPIIDQGEGDLGDRINAVYSQLLLKHENAFIVGSDAPQFTTEDLRHACKKLLDHDYVLGPSKDGGFWLFGGTKPVAAEIWKATPWSTPQTCATLQEKLKGKVAFINSYTDVDEVSDIKNCVDEFTITDPSPHPIIAFSKKIANVYK